MLSLLLLNDALLCNISYFPGVDILKIPRHVHLWTPGGDNVKFRLRPRGGAETGPDVYNHNAPLSPVLSLAVPSVEGRAGPENLLQ